MKYDEILLSTNPDAGYEYFWLNYKDTIMNFYKVHGMNNTVLYTNIISQLDPISSELNKLQTLQEYNKIALIIENVLIRYCWICIGYPESAYLLSLCLTDLKRWEPYRSKVNYGLDIVTLICHVTKTRDITAGFCFLLPAPIDIIEPIPRYLEATIIHLVEASISIGNESVIGRLFAYAQNQGDGLFLINIIKNKYDITLPKGIKDGRKILKLIMSSKK